MSIYKYASAFAVGAFAYTLIEIVWRGHTHWTMTLTGGVCLAMIYMWNDYLVHHPLWTKCIIGALSITVVEFVVGCVVNLIFHGNVWDYSGLRFNIMGQVCLTFTLMWYLLSIPAFYVCDLIKKYINV